MKITALIIFIAVYAIMIFAQRIRVWGALGGALLFLIIGIVPVTELTSAIDFNVLLMISGMMITVSYFQISGMPMRIADILLDKSKDLRMLTIYLSLFAGVVSAFIDNVATVLMIAPVALAVAKKQKVSPVPMIISIAVSSNLQGAATLVGDTTSILLGGYAKMTFSDFFVMDGKAGIFWSVELGAVLTIPVMMIIFRKFTQPVDADEKTEVTDYVPTISLLMTIVVLIIASFFKNRPELTNGIVCCTFAVICIINSFIKTGEGRQFDNAVHEFDWQTVLLLASLFVVVYGITAVGIIDDIAEFFVKVGGSNLFFLYSLIVWGSVLVSAFIDNIPYVSAMLPVISGIAAKLNIDPNLLYFGLLCGATLGGNLTPIGASANITGIGILRKNGYEVKTSDFTRISVPFTLTAVTAGYIFLWFVWA